MKTAEDIFNKHCVLVTNDWHEYIILSKEKFIAEIEAYALDEIRVIEQPKTPQGFKKYSKYEQTESITSADTLVEQPKTTDINPEKCATVCIGPDCEGCRDFKPKTDPL